MLFRIVACSVLLSPLMLVGAAPTAGAAAQSPSGPSAVAARTVAVTAAQPVLRLGWQPGPLGSMYRPNYFYRGYALHGMTSVPAYPASHGCVRMTVPTMDRMWSSLWIGMPVAVYRS